MKLLPKEAASHRILHAPKIELVHWAAKYFAVKVRVMTSNLTEAFDRRLV